MKGLQFFIRHQPKFLQEKMILVFNNEATRDYFETAIPGCHFEKVTSEQAEHAARIGINGKTVPFGYTSELTEEEMGILSTANWEETATLLAAGNERLYDKARQVKR